jgi:hypothetical protein
MLIYVMTHSSKFYKAWRSDFAVEGVVLMRHILEVPYSTLGSETVCPAFRGFLRVSQQNVILIFQIKLLLFPSTSFPIVRFVIFGLCNVTLLLKVKVKLCLCGAFKTAVSEGSALSVANLDTKWSSVVSFRLRPFTSEEGVSDTHWIGGGVSPRARPNK